MTAHIWIMQQICNTRNDNAGHRAGPQHLFLDNVFKHWLILTFFAVFLKWKYLTYGTDAQFHSDSFLTVSFYAIPLETESVFTHKTVFVIRCISKPLPCITATRDQFLYYVWYQAFSREMHHSYSLLGYYAAYSGNFLPKFRYNLKVQSSTVEKFKFLNLEDGIYRLSRNVDKELPL